MHRRAGQQIGRDAGRLGAVEQAAHGGEEIVLVGTFERAEHRHAAARQRQRAALGDHVVDVGFAQRVEQARARVDAGGRHERHVGIAAARLGDEHAPALRRRDVEIDEQRHDVAEPSTGSSLGNGDVRT